MPSEFSFIDRIRRQAAIQRPGLHLGIGDDTAIFDESSGRERLVTVDLLIEDVHFRLGSSPMRCLGHKALAVSLSDIAAMGGSPDYSLLSLGIPHDRQTDGDWDEFFGGYFDLAGRYGVALIGGDTSTSRDKLVIDSIVLGSCNSGASIRRSGARIGDWIFVTGSLGAAAAGLRCLESGLRPGTGASTAQEAAMSAHLMPQPRVEFGMRLGGSGLAHSMIDVSDGLAQDLGHICEESLTDGVLDYGAIPIADCVSALTASSTDAFSLAVSGVEDYELLFTASPDSRRNLEALAADCGLNVTPIGEITGRANGRRQPAVHLRRDGRIDLLAVKGYDHFRP